MYELRIKHLKESHKALDKKIDGLESTGIFDDAMLEYLKKQRLKLKDQIEFYQHLDLEEAND
jgi:uncharacterized protein YdcH (DUF465 family)